MKRTVYLFVLLFGILAGTNYGQKVEVDQSFIDDATKAFDLVVAQRKVIEDFQKERATSNAERASAQVLINAFDALIKVKDQISAEKDKIIALYAQVIDLQQKIILNLEKQLSKPKSAFQKFLKGLKEVLLIVTGVLIGRGL